MDSLGNSRMHVWKACICQYRVFERVFQGNIYFPYREFCV